MCAISWIFCSIFLFKICKERWKNETKTTRFPSGVELEERNAWSQLLSCLANKPGLWTDSLECGESFIYLFLISLYLVISTCITVLRKNSGASKGNSLYVSIRKFLILIIFLSVWNMLMYPDLKNKCFLLLLLSHFESSFLSCCTSVRRVWTKP